MIRLSIIFIFCCCLKQFACAGKSKSHESSIQKRVQKFNESLEVKMEKWMAKVDQMNQDKPKLGLLLKNESNEVEIPELARNWMEQVGPQKVTQIVKRFSSGTRRQQNCLKMRQFLEVFPSTPSYFSSFWNFLWNPFGRSDPHDEMKSYRTVAYNILTGLSHLEASTASEVSQKVRELREMKVLYFGKYYRTNPNELKEKKKTREATLKEIRELESQIKSAQKETESIERRIRQNHKILSQFVKKGSKEKERLQNLMDEVERLNRVKTRIDLAATEEEVAELAKGLKNKSFYHELGLQLRLFHDYSSVLELLDFLSTRSQMPASTKKMFREQEKKMKGDLESLEARIAKKKKYLTAIFEREIKKNEDLLKKDLIYANYKKMVQMMIDDQKKLNATKDELGKWRVAIEQKKLSLDSFNAEDFSDFVISPQVLFNLKAQLEQMKQIFTFDGSPNQSKSSRKDPVKAKKGDSVDAFREGLRHAQTRIDASLQEDIQNAIDGTAKQLYLIARIEDHEKELDEILGHLFSEIFEMEDGMRCFSLSQLSYLFFNLFKTNTVSNQHRFLIVFLSRIQFSHAREFILYNLSLFSTKEFIDNFEASFALNESGPTEKLRKEKEYMSQFAVNFVSVIDFYKELTEFKDPSRAVEGGGIFMKVWRSVGIDLGRMLIEDITEFTLEEVIKDIVKRVVKLVPFISSVPFLDFVAEFLVWKITQFLTQQFMKLFSRFIPVISAKMSSIFESFQKKNYGFDYQKIIDKELNPEPPGTDVKLTFQNLDKIYFNAFTSQADLFQLVLENSRFYRPKDSNRTLQKFESDLDYFNKFVIGELILERFFEAQVPVHVKTGETTLDLSTIHDYSTKSHLFDSLYSSFSVDPHWKNRFFDIYNAKSELQSPSENTHQSLYLTRI